MSFIIILLASCFAPEPQPIGQVSIPHDEVVITFMAEEDDFMNEASSK